MPGLKCLRSTRRTGRSSPLMMLDKTTKALYFLGDFLSISFFKNDPNMRLIKLTKVLVVGIAALTLQTGCAPQVTPTNSRTGQNNLTSEVRRMQAALSGQERVIQELTRSVADLSARLDLQQQQLQELHSPPNTTFSAGPTGQATMPPPAETARPVDGNAIAAEVKGSPTDIYLRAFGDYANGRYAAAILGFETFLRNFPNNNYASNAQFRLADCYLKQQQLAKAIDEFNKVLQLYPNAAKVPDALLKIATAQMQMDNPEEARVTLQTLQQRYPESAAAQKAEQLDLP